MPELTVNEDLLEAYTAAGVPQLRVYEPASLCAVLGAAGRPEQDLLLEALAADGVPWKKRRGGGGTVVLGPGQVVLALVKEVASPFRNKEYAATINSWIVEALENLGVRADGTAKFSERACARGLWGTISGQVLIRIAMAYAGKLKKFGA